MIAFLHIPKTSGSTIRDFFKKSFEPSSCIFWYGSANFSSGLTGLAGKITPDTKLLFGHFHYGIHKLLHQPVNYFTILRDPVERMISHYEYTRSVNPDQSEISDVVCCARSEDIISFLKAYPEICNEQTLYLSPDNPGSPDAAIKHLQMMNFGIHPYTDLFIHAVERELGVKHRYYKNKKINTVKVRYEADKRRQIAGLCQVDLELFSRAKELYLRNMRMREGLLPVLNRYFSCRNRLHIY